MLIQHEVVDAAAQSESHLLRLHPSLNFSGFGGPGAVQYESVACYPYTIVKRRKGLDFLIKE